MNAAILVFGSLFALLFGTSDNGGAATQYIEKYRELAISEMHRTNIPASIKMAQAILESGLGQSTLATQANNHFGIKCGGGWNGDTYFREDDDYKQGKLIKSCFRKFDSPAHSFVAHSDFLRDQPRYSSLFNLNPTDYEGWAYGLRAAGYATDKAYPTKLINIINKYNLSELDRGRALASTLESNNKKPGSKSSITRKTSTETKRSNSESKSTASRSKYSAYYASSEMNKTKIVVSNGELSLRQIARDQDIDLDDIKKYNEDLDLRSTSQAIPKGEVVFLEKRKKSYFGSNKYHTLKSGESMRTIARKYGVSLEFLYIKNRMPLDSQPLVGEKVYLKGIVRLNNGPKFKKKGDTRKKERSVLF